MGRAYNKQIRDIFSLIKKMQREVQKAIKRQDVQIAEKLLAETQEAAIVLGTNIETYLGEGTNTVKAIEEYCELIYQLHDALKQRRKVDVILSRLRGQWQQISQIMEEELPNQYEIVFLPYKVSMWDSLESVWRAADEDPDCNALVIPIPYYDKNPDGTFRNEHYEGEEFPEDVPITHYLEYDLENRHPDVIFIHNPYDDHNFVTSVHPYFYTQKLQQCTEKLVYIPYYISDETNPDSKEAIEGKAAITLTKGVLNSDMVFLQSENTKKLFVNILTKYFDDIDQSYWENKIWGLGSPKLDRVNRVIRDDARLPQEWRDIIYKESGARKKVVFYNISITPLLNNPDMINKIKNVLAYFKDNKDVALWWRPHPLYESTLASMKPDMLLEYQQVVNQYKQEGWGIFDDGVDLQWAIAETDAYYGDSSSVVQLYKEAEKPVMIQDVFGRVKSETKAEDIPIWPSAFCVDGDDIWFVHGLANILMRYSIKEKYTYVIGPIPDEVMFKGSLYKGIYKWKNRIILIPSGARSVAVYDCINENFDKIAIDNSEKYIGKALFAKVYAEGKYLYCIPFVYEAILKFDMDSNQIEYIMTERMVGTYLSDTTRMGSRIIATYGYTNQVLIYDMNSDSVLYRQLGNKSRQYTKIANIGSNLYLFDDYMHCIVMISQEDITREKEFYSVSCAKVKMTAISPDYFLLDMGDDHVMQIMDENGEMVCYKEEMAAKKQSSLYAAFTAGIESDSPILFDNFYYFSRVTYTMWQFKGTVLERQFSMSIRGNALDDLQKQLVGLEDMESNENDIYGLEIWIKGLIGRKNIRHNEKLSNGGKILQVVKEKLNESGR